MTGLAAEKEKADTGLSTPQRFLQLIQEVGRLLEKNYDQRSPLSRNQSRLVAALLERDGQTQTELSAALHMHKVSVGIYAAELEELGLVERRSHPTDGRAKCIFLTPLLHATAHIGLEIFTEIHRRAVENIPAADHEIMLACMQRMRDNLRQLDREAADAVASPAEPTGAD